MKSERDSGKRGSPTTTSSLSPPGEPSTNSYIEDKNRRVIDGTVAPMIAAMTPYAYWSFAAVM